MKINAIILLIFSLLIAAVIGFHCSGSEESVDAGLASTGHCLCPANKCNNGLCLDNANCSCNPDCTTVGDTCTIADTASGTCYFLGVKDYFGCMATGTKVVGEICGTESDCIAGAQCMERGGAKNCYQVCTDTCKTGTCTDTGFGFKICTAS